MKSVLSISRIRVPFVGRENTRTVTDGEKIMNYAAKRKRTRCTSRLICHGARSLPSSCRDRLIDPRRTTPDLYADATTGRNAGKSSRKVASTSNAPARLSADLARVLGRSILPRVTRFRVKPRASFTPVVLRCLFI